MEAFEEELPRDPRKQFKHLARKLDSLDFRVRREAVRFVHVPGVGARELGGMVTLIPEYLTVEDIQEVLRGVSYKTALKFVKNRIEPLGAVIDPETWGRGHCKIICGWGLAKALGLVEVAPGMYQPPPQVLDGSRVRSEPMREEPCGRHRPSPCKGKAEQA